MSIEKEILKLYREIEKSKKFISEASDVYDNVDFKNIGLGNPASDNINTSLLADVETAAKNAGVKVDITTAISGHKKNTKSGNTSRHPSGNAVDISIIDGKSVSAAIKPIVDKFVDELVKLGYVKNSESGNPKSVLTFGTPGHDDHVHVSNKTNTPSTSTSNTTTTTTTNTASQDAYNAATSQSTTSTGGYSDVVGSASSTKGLMEQKSFGKNVSNRYGKVIIPKDDNSKIKSPISGIINNSKYFSNCKNQITIESNGGNKTYLQFCGISNPSVRNGKSISAGDTIGTTDSDVEVTLYDSTWNLIPISSSGLKTNKNTEIKKDEEDKKKTSSEPEYYDPLFAAIMGIPSKLFKDKYDSSGKKIEKRYGGVSDKKQVDPWILNFIEDPFKRKKVNENIERIKKIL